MNTLYFSRIGLELKKAQVKTQEEKIKALQKEAADAAGVSYDWHDNFGAEDATRQAEMEMGFLSRLVEEVKHAKIVEPEEQTQRVLIGTTVKLLVNGKEQEFTIGAYGESDPGKGLISYTSPLAIGLLEIKAGDSKTIRVGDKNLNILIKDILPPSYKYHELVEPAGILKNPQDLKKN